MEVSLFGRLLLPDNYLTGTSFQILRTFRICFSHSFFFILARSAKNLTEACRKIGEKQRTKRPSCFANGKVVGGINPKKAGTEHLGLPVFANCTEAKKATGCNATVLGFEPPWQRGGVLGGSLTPKFNLTLNRQQKKSRFLSARCGEVIYVPPPAAASAVMEAQPAAHYQLTERRIPNFWILSDSQ